MGLMPFTSVAAALGEGRGTAARAAWWRCFWGASDPNCPVPSAGETKVATGCLSDVSLPGQVLLFISLTGV